MISFALIVWLVSAFSLGSAGSCSRGSLVSIVTCSLLVTNPSSASPAPETTDSTSESALQQQAEQSLEGLKEAANAIDELSDMIDVQIAQAERNADEGGVPDGYCCGRYEAGNSKGDGDSEPWINAFQNFDLYMEWHRLIDRPCAEYWRSSEDEGCHGWQYGCPVIACDADSEKGTAADGTLTVNGDHAYISWCCEDEDCSNGWHTCINYLNRPFNPYWREYDESTGYHWWDPIDGFYEWKGCSALKTKEACDRVPAGGWSNCWWQDDETGDSCWDSHDVYTSWNSHPARLNEEEAAAEFDMKTKAASTASADSSASTDSYSVAVLAVPLAFFAVVVLAIALFCALRRKNAKEKEKKKTEEKMADESVEMATDAPITM